MVRLRYIQANGEEHVIEAQPGRSIMENAVKNNVPGIAADCGGVCACATCRVYVEDDGWRRKLGEPSEMEQSMIEFAGDATAGVRLSCQIVVTPEHDGLSLRLPETQH